MVATIGSARRQARLLERARRNESGARDAVLRELMPVAQRVARKFANSHHPAEDLAQVAGIGLLKAIDRFDPSREASFTTYAQALMSGEVRRHMRDTRLMRVPRAIYEQVPRFQRELERLRAELGRAPSRDELAVALGVSKEDVIEIADAALTAQPISLEASLADFGGTAEVGGDDHALERVEDEAALAPMLRALSDRERVVLDLRFDQGLSQGEIGAGLGLSQTQVSRILRCALDKMSKQALAGV